MNHPTKPLMDEAAPAAHRMIEDSVARLFGSRVDKAQRERAEAGQLDAALWQQVADSGFPLLLATEAAGGLGQGWAAAYPVLRGLGAWQVPLPLAETMVAAQLLSLAGLGALALALVDAAAEQAGHAVFDHAVGGRRRLVHRRSRRVVHWETSVLRTAV